MRVLVAYATRHGATAGIAGRIAAALTAAGLPAEARPVDDVKDVEPYDAVVLGGAAYMFHWLKPAVTFARRHRKELAARPVWLFSSGPLGTDLVDKDGRNVLEPPGPRSSTSSRSCCTHGVSRSSSAPTTRTRHPPVSASGSCSTCLPRGPPCRPATSATGLPSTHGPRRSPRSWGPADDMTPLGDAVAAGAGSGIPSRPGSLPRSTGAHGRHHRPQPRPRAAMPRSGCEVISGALARDAFASTISGSLTC